MDHDERELLIASRYGQFDLVKYLIDHGVKIETKDEDEHTPLLCATLGGHLEIVRFLLDCGAQIESSTGFDQTPLIIAADKGHNDIIQLLLERGAKTEATDYDGKTSIIHAASKGHLKAVIMLASVKANLEAADSHGRTALMQATEKGYLEVVQWLLQKGVMLEMKNKNGKTALMSGCERGHLDIIQALLNKGANIEATDLEGQTPLMYAVLRNQPKIVSALLERKANMEVKDSDGKRSLMIAAMEGHFKVVKLLVDKCAKIDESDKYGMTALMYAAENNHVDVIRYLVEKGANINVKDLSGKTALICASQKTSSKDVVEFLIRHMEKVVAFNISMHQQLKLKDEYCQYLASLSLKLVKVMSNRRFNDFLYLLIRLFLEIQYGKVTWKSMCSLLRHDIYIPSLDLSFVWQSVASSSINNTNATATSSSDSVLQASSSSGKESKNKKKGGLTNFFSSPTPSPAVARSSSAAAASSVQVDSTAATVTPAAVATSNELWNSCKQAMTILQTAFQGCHNEYLLHVHILGDAEVSEAGEEHQLSVNQRRKQMMQSIGEALAYSKVGSNKNKADKNTVKVEIDVLGENSHRVDGKKEVEMNKNDGYSGSNSKVKTTMVRFTCYHYDELSDYHTKTMHHHLVMIHYYYTDTINPEASQLCDICDVNVLNILNLPYSVYLIVLPTTTTTSVTATTTAVTTTYRDRFASYDEQANIETVGIEDGESIAHISISDAAQESQQQPRQQQRHVLSIDEVVAKYKYWLNLLYSVIDREDILLPPLAPSSSSSSITPTSNTFAGPATEHHWTLPATTTTTPEAMISPTMITMTMIGHDNLQQEQTEYNLHLNQYKNRYHNNKRREYRCRRTAGTGSSGYGGGGISSGSNNGSGMSTRRKRSNGLRTSFPYVTLQGIPIVTIVDSSGLLYQVETTTSTSSTSTNKVLRVDEKDTLYLEHLQLALVKQLQSLYSISHLPSQRTVDFLVPYDVIYVIDNKIQVDQWIPIMVDMFDICDEYAGVAGTLTTSPLLKHVSQCLATQWKEIHQAKQQSGQQSASDGSVANDEVDKVMVVKEEEWKLWLRRAISSYYHSVAIPFVPSASSHGENRANQTPVTNTIPPASARYALALDEDLWGLSLFPLPSSFHHYNRHLGGSDETGRLSSFSSDDEEDDISSALTKEVLAEAAMGATKVIGKKLSKEQRDEITDILIDYCTTYLLDTTQVMLIQDCKPVLQGSTTSTSSGSYDGNKTMRKAWKKSIIIDPYSFFTTRRNIVDSLSKKNGQVIVLIEKGTKLTYYHCIEDNEKSASMSVVDTNKATVSTSSHHSEFVSQGPTTIIEHEISRFFDLIDYQSRRQLFTGFFEQLYWSLLHRHGFEVLPESKENRDCLIRLTKKCRYPLASMPTTVATTASTSITPTTGVKKVPTVVDKVKPNTLHIELTLYKADASSSSIDNCEDEESEVKGGNTICVDGMGGIYVNVRIIHTQHALPVLATSSVDTVASTNTTSTTSTSSASSTISLSVEQRKKEREKEKEREKIWKTYLFETTFEVMNLVRQLILKEECFGLRFREQCLSICSNSVDPLITLSNDVDEGERSIVLTTLLKDSLPMEDVLLKLFGIPIQDSATTTNHTKNGKESNQLDDFSDDVRSPRSETCVTSEVDAVSPTSHSSIDDGTEEKRDRSQSMGTTGTGITGGGGSGKSKGSKGTSSLLRKEVKGGDREDCLIARQSVLALFFGDKPSYHYEEESKKKSEPDHVSSSSSASPAPVATTSSMLISYDKRHSSYCYEKLMIPLAPLDLPLKYLFTFSSRMTPITITDVSSSYQGYYQVESERHRDFLYNFLIKHCHSREEVLQRLTNYHQSKKRIRLTIDDEACMRDFLLRLLYLYSISPNASDHERELDGLLLGHTSVSNARKVDDDGDGCDDEDEDDDEEEFGISLQEFDHFVTTYGKVWIRNKPFVVPTPVVTLPSVGSVSSLLASSSVSTKFTTTTTIGPSQTPNKVANLSIGKSNVAGSQQDPSYVAPSVDSMASSLPNSNSVSQYQQQDPGITLPLATSSSLDSWADVREKIRLELEQLLHGHEKTVEATSMKNQISVLNSTVTEEKPALLVTQVSQTNHTAGELKEEEGSSSKSGRSDASHASSGSDSSNGGERRAGVTRGGDETREKEGGEGVEWTPFVGALALSKSNSHGNEEGDDGEDDNDDDDDDDDAFEMERSENRSVAAIASVVTMSMARIRMKFRFNKR